MEPPAITRYRRPFLAPLWIALLVAVVGAAVLVAAWRNATTTVLVLVHSVEKDPGSISDPPLSAEGEERAQRLAQILGSTARVDAIYVSDDRRARQTAAPLSERLQLTPAVFAAADAGAMTERALREHAGGTVVVVVSDAALPQMLRDVGGEDLVSGRAADADVMYVVSIPSFGRPHQLRLKY